MFLQRLVVLATILAALTAGSRSLAAQTTTGAITGDRPVRVPRTTPPSARVTKAPMSRPTP